MHLSFRAGEGFQDAQIALKPAAPAKSAHLEFLRRPAASPPLCGYVPSAALDDKPRARAASLRSHDINVFKLATCDYLAEDATLRAACSGNFSRSHFFSQSHAAS